MFDITDKIDDEVHLQESESNDIPDSKVVAAIKAVTIDVFFDGTGNNMFNTDHRTEDEKIIDEEYEKQNISDDISEEEAEEIRNKIRKNITKFGHLKGEISYDNDYSNVVHLYKASTINDTKTSVYIEGAGTVRDEGDKTLGLGMAWGESGINERVKEAFALSQEKADELNAQLLIFNVYGFSRGAFYGRYFCAMLDITDSYIYDSSNYLEAANVSAILSERILCGRDLLGYAPYHITINFVGIYDTVTSEGSSPNNDAIPFRQDIGAKQRIKKIFHLTAQDEFRNHFPLAQINTAISQKNLAGKYIGFECSIPGAHADIGGGYIKPWPEKRYLSLFDKPRWDIDLGNSSEIHWTWFQSKGYYSSNGTTVEKKQGVYGEFEVKEVHRPTGYEMSEDEVPIDYEVYATREIPNNEYQFIGLNLMYEVAKQEGGESFNNPSGVAKLVECTESVAGSKADPNLKEFNNYALAIIKDKVVNGGRYAIKLDDCPQLTPEKCQAIYHDFIHNTLIAKMIWKWKNKTDYMVNGGDRNNKDADFNPRRIITQDNQGYWYNRSATDRTTNS